jgi:5-methylcytosine-specific restriction protein A
MTGRAVPEWVGKSPDTQAPTRVRLRVFEAHGGRCHISGRKIAAGDAWELEHVKPLHLGGENRESNLAPALATAHREKTSAEMSAKAKADRIRAKHLGVFPASKTPLRSRGFAKTRDWRPA